MSRAAYEAHFGTAAPPGALFGVDVSWFQAGNSAGGLDYGVCAGYWADFARWADFVCVRTSYGAAGDDGAQDLHFQLAAEHRFGGAMGTYHFVGAGRSTADNASNYLARSDRLVDRTSFDMLDFEASPVASGAYIGELCDRVSQARQRPCLIYSGKSYLDQAGAISCPAQQLWVAHYAPAGSNAWEPTTDWSSWDAPLVPNQYAGQYPGVWQWSSLTPEHGHLDLNISTTPEAFGGTLGPAASEDLFTVSQYDDIMSKLAEVETQMGQHTGGVYTRIDQLDASLGTQMGQHVQGVYTRIDQLQDHGDQRWSAGAVPPPIVGMTLEQALAQATAAQLLAALGGKLVIPPAPVLPDDEAAA